MTNLDEKPPGLGLADRPVRHDASPAPAAPADELQILRDEVRGLVLEVQRLNQELQKMRGPPHIVGTVREALPDGRLIVKSSTGPDFVVPVRSEIDAAAVEAGTRVGLSQPDLSVVGLLPAAPDPMAAAEVLQAPSVTYDDIGGLDEVIEDLRETVEFPLTRPAAYAAIGVTPPKGVLLHGPPGTGKTLLAKAVAGASDATFLRLVGSELVQKFIGEGARRVREVFALARRKAPTVLFIDEIDALAGRRSGGEAAASREVERTLMQLLAELDGFEERGDVRIIAATNRLDVLDPALLRPGRFDRLIEVPVPDADGLRRILDVHCKRLTLAGVDLDQVAGLLTGSTGAEIRAVCTEAGMHAVRHGREAIGPRDFEAAVDRLHRGRLVPPASDLYA